MPADALECSSLLFPEVNSCGYELQEAWVKNRGPYVLLLLILLSWLPGCEQSDVDTITPKVSPGVTEKEILLGSSLALQGHASFLGA